MMTLAETLRLARDRKNLTLRQLSELSGVHNALISQMETGHVKEPSFRNVVKIARALNLSLSRFADTVE
jgi:transcriptional regulator with XRE-family HTH domain